MGTARPTPTLTPTPIPTCRPAGEYVVPCTDWALTTGDHLGYGGYEESTDTEGEECGCSGTFEGYGASYYLNAASFDGTSIEPYRVGTDAPPSDLDETGKNPNPTSSGWTVNLSPSTSSPVVLDGDYYGYLSTFDSSRDPITCADSDAGYILDIRESASAAAASPPPSDDGRECTSLGTPVAARFRLFPHPGGIHPGPGREAVAVYRQGSTQHGNVETSTIEVLDFADAEAILVYAGQELVAQLDPVQTTSATLSGETLGKLTLAVVDDDQRAGQPEIRIVGTCATLSQTVTRAQGYLVTSAAFNTWFGVTAKATARVQNDASGGRTLMLEIPGTTLNMGLPLVHTGGPNYTLDYEGFDFEIHGTVVHGTTTLSITVTSGSVGSTALPPGTFSYAAL